MTTKNELYTNLHSLYIIQQEELKKLDENDIAYTILEQEISDISWALQSLAIAIPEERNHHLSNVRNFTSSSRLSNLLTPYLKEEQN